MKVIKVLCKADGTVVMESLGFKGKACEQATKVLEEALGMERTSERKTPEFYKEDKVQIVGKT